MSIMIYMVQVSVCLGIFYALYYFLLKRLTFFTINRWYLLATLAISFIIPLLTITVRQEYVPAIQSVLYFNKLQNLSGQLQAIHTQKVVEVSRINLLVMLEALYMAVAVALFIRLVIVMAVLITKLKFKRSSTIGSVRVIRGTQSVENGSFFNYIFLKDENLDHEESQQIVRHEMLHVKLFHSVDRIILELAKIVLWFNPFVYLYSRAVEENHEFEVDYEIGRSADKNKYADLLLRLSISGQSTVYNTFSKVPLERRITMLFNQPTKSMKKMIYVLVLPIGVLSCLAFANLKVENRLNDFKRTEFASAPYTVASREAMTSANTNISYKSFAGLDPQLSSSQFYSRTHFQDKNGRRFDKITFKLVDGAASANLGTEDRAGAFIDGSFFNEDEIKKLPAERTALLTFDRCEGIKPENIPEGNYAIPFCFKTKVKQ
jgi:prepilin signal peptidase PulO-like enzyme (type II secretory pathway)